ncbi:hypothetical protein AVEN_26114-1 [Araneus ventricosus]|uniref:Uncharacterized protein n=1 Tax=Araneus ventricosus TaxID=182803 RepID=A0A4Y2NYS2_ARAVE|nr:hypothetical protein AVEN_26114-1 [Araneus ventricosus]
MQHADRRKFCYSADSTRPHATSDPVLDSFWLGSFPEPLPAPTLRQAIFIFSAISNIISAATLSNVTEDGSSQTLPLGYQTQWQVSMKEYSKSSCN